MTVRILHGDALELLRTLADESVHSVVTDPPYGLEFMGKEWDSFKTGRSSLYAKGGTLDLDAMAERSGKGGAGPQYVNRPAKRCGKCGKQGWSGSPCKCPEPEWIMDNSPLHSFQAFCEAWARECLRVLKPGGHLLSFGGSRTYHRMACAIEDAGFEIRDQIFWCYGSGFPKSLNVNKALEADDAVCRCAEDHVHLQRVPDSDAAIRIADEAQESADLLLPLQRNVARGRVGNARVERCERTQELYGIEGVSESGLERRRHDLQAQGQLREHPLRASARLGEADGAQGRLSDGAPSCDGGMVRLSPDASRDGASPQPSADREPANESGTVAGQPQPQARGAWPICDRCGKSMVTKGLGTALKPAHEPIVVARKPLIGTVAANVLKHGTGAINVDACRIESGADHAAKCASVVGLDSNRNGYAYGEWSGARTDSHSTLGRWPANLIHDGSDEVLAGFPDAKAAYVNEDSAAAKLAEHKPTTQRGVTSFDDGKPCSSLYTDSGSAARFFYTAKSSGDDRNVGSHSEDERNHHPTVKPTDLMQYLVRLVTPPGGTVLDPFAGSGTTGLAADREGFDAILIEREAEYVEIARRRIVGDCPLFAELAA